MTIKIEATRHELEKIKTLARMVDTVLDGGDSPSWRDVMYEVQEMLTEAELCEAEPLIEDEKIRKAVRAWAEAQGLTEVYCASSGYEIYGGVDDLVIQFKGEPFPFADKNRAYTITELCGEGEMNYWEMIKAISPYNYSIKNKLINNTELCGESQNDANMSL